MRYYPIQALTTRRLVMRKAGMVFQRRLPQKYGKQGILHDALEYSITSQQWAGR